MSNAPKSAHRIGTRIYPVRTVAYLLFAISVAATSLHFYERLIPQAITFVSVALLYPHLAYQVYRRTGQHRRVEFHILTFDMFLIAWIAAQFYFSPIVSLVPVAVNSASNLATGGLRLFLRGLGAFLVGCLLFGALNSFEFRMAYSDWALLMSGLYMVMGTHYIGFLANVQGIMIRKSRAKILDQKQTIERSNRSLTSSINYARRIQEAILPFEDRIRECFGAGNFFILYRPLHIVSGDFYWLERLDENRIIVVVADCTGHGVPGAFMSLIGSKILDEVVLQRRVWQPDQILENLNQEIRRILRQDHNGNQDGMEAVVLSLDLEGKSVAFSGAMNSLYYVHEGVFHEIRGSRKWLGGDTLLKDKTFACHEGLPLDSTFYLCSDGFQDQFGGEKRRKFTRRRFRQTLRELTSLPLTEQGERLRKIHESWKEAGGERQTDDITVMGFRLPGR